MAGFVRFLAGTFLLVAVIFAVNDVTRGQVSGQSSFASLYEGWATLSPATLKSAQANVQRYTHPAVWTWGIANALQLPAWALLGGIGLLLAYAGRRRRRVNIYAN